MAGEGPEGEAPGGLPPPRFLIDAPWLRAFVGGRIIAGYLKHSFRTSTIAYDPPGLMAANKALEPAIFVSWHANILASPIMVPDPKNLVSMAAPHPDGQMGGATSRAFGIETITATGRSAKQSAETGGLAGFRAMLRKLASGKSVYLTGEVPPTPGRQVGRGTLALARLSGRPIIAVSASSSRRTIYGKLWDQMQLLHAHGRIVVTASEPLFVGKDEDAAAAELKLRLDEVYARALRLAEEGGGSA